jgi:hypothetical protein
MASSSSITKPTIIRVPPGRSTYDFNAPPSPGTTRIRLEPEDLDGQVYPGPATRPTKLPWGPDARSFTFSCMMKGSLDVQQLECVVDDSICHHCFGALKLLSMDRTEAQFSGLDFWNEVRDSREPGFRGFIFGIPREFQESWMGKHGAVRTCQLCERMRQWGPGCVEASRMWSWARWDECKANGGVPYYQPVSKRGKTVTRDYEYGDIDALLEPDALRDGLAATIYDMGGIDKARGPEHKFDYWRLRLEPGKGVPLFPPEDDTNYYSPMLAETVRDCLTLPGLEIGDTIKVPTDACSCSEHGAHPLGPNGVCHAHRFARLYEWLDECLDTHWKCKRPTDLRLPGRLLDVSAKRDGMDTIKLVDAFDLVDIDNLADEEDYAMASLEGRDLARASLGALDYVALSYCWGPEPHFKTTRATLRERQHEIKIEDMPPVLADAILITRQCGFQYCWIDALCIVQDDAEDWEREAVKMGDIYAAAQFTISALNSADNQHSILKKRRGTDCFSIGDVKLPNLGAGPKQTRFFFRHDVQEVDAEIYRGPLSTRSWTLQERLLSPAIVHYGRDQIMWECNHGEIRSETGFTKASDPLRRTLTEWARSRDRGKKSLSNLGDTSRDRLSFIYHGSLPKDTVHIRGSYEEDPDNEGIRSYRSCAELLREPIKIEESDPYAVWHRIIEEYSERHITKVSDRLCALYGIVQRLSKLGLSLGSFAAGHWEEDFPRGLLWASHIDDTPTPRNILNNQKRAPHLPTWSWGHCGLPISHAITKHEEGELKSCLRGHPTFIGARKLEGYGNDQKLPISWAHIRITGFVQRLEEGVLAHFYANQGRTCAKLELQDRGYVQWYMDNARIESSAARQNAYFCVRIAQWQTVTDSPDFNTSVYYLILEKVVDEFEDGSLQALDSYLRLGVLISQDSRKRALVQPWTDVELSSDLPMLSCGCWQSILLE